VSVRIAFLGGLGEIGRNCAVLEIDDQLALIDVGLMFPDEEMLGVDLVLPDFSSVLERRQALSCVILTHGHEDHIGALGYLLREVSVPVYGTPLTLELVRARVGEMGIEPDLRPVEPRTWVEHGPFRFSHVSVTHSVPDATGIAFDTPEGLVIHSGDFKLDPTPIDGLTTDLQTFAGFGRQGVRLLLADSTNAERPGFVPSESTVGGEIEDIVREASGRVIIACFASHLHRVQQAIDAVVADGRKFAFIGRSMLRNSEIALEHGYLDIPKKSLVELDQLLVMPPDKTAVISTGSQGEPFAALSLMAAGEHRSVTLDPDDTVIISATPIPGNEKRVSRVINNLTRAGVSVFHGRNAPVHVSGHAAATELKTFYNVVQPQALIPVHGEYRHLAANADIGAEMGIPQVEICEDGDVAVLEDGKLWIERQAVSSSYVYVDGTELEDDPGVIRDRQHLADDGVVLVTVGVDKRNGDIVFGPDVDSHGVTGDADEMHKAIRTRVEQGISTLERPIDHDALQRRVRNSARKAVQNTMKRRPVVFPVIIEI
jgi:ribonuclease J